MKKSTKANLIFLVLVAAVLAAAYLALHSGRGAGRVAVLQYGDDSAELRIPLDEPGVYDVDTGYYTIHLRVADGAIAFVDSPCPDHLCEGFGELSKEGDWAACLPAHASLTIQ